MQTSHLAMQGGPSGSQDMVIMMTGRGEKGFGREVFGCKDSDKYLLQYEQATYPPRLRGHLQP